MIEIRGKYNTAIAYTDTLDDESISQIITLLNQPLTKELVIRMMPDVHAGKGCVVGTTMTVKDQVIPALVGVDIGCGMYVVKLKEKEIDLSALDALIRSEIPSGMEVREKAHPFLKKARLSALYCRDALDMMRAQLSIGSLGGGNHFIEVDKDEEDNLYLVIHSGSRNAGKQMAEYYQNRGYHRLNGSDYAAEQELIARLKSEGKKHRIEDELKKLRNTKRTAIPKELAYVEGGDLADYLFDMDIMQEYADLNRKAMAQVILKGLHLNEVDSFTTVHNYIDIRSKILRKGAVSAKSGEILLIPMNMRDGSLICRGKGNPDWNYSAPHGAGRLMSRGAAKARLSLEEYQREMSGIFTTSVGFGTLDESPMAYKPMEEIVRHIEPTVEILTVIKPVYNFKASE